MFGTWRAIYTHSDVPENVSTKMWELLEQTIHDPDFKEYMADSGLEYADTFASPAEFAEWLPSEVDRVRELLREAGVI